MTALAAAPHPPLSVLIWHPLPPPAGFCLHGRVTIEIGGIGLALYGALLSVRRDGTARIVFPEWGQQIGTRRSWQPSAGFASVAAADDFAAAVWAALRASPIYRRLEAPQTARCATFTPARPISTVADAAREIRP